MIKGVLLDLSGVIYVGDRLMPGALDAIDQLHRCKLPIRFITNTTRSTQDSILKKLSGKGFDIPKGQLFTAPQAARTYMDAHGLIPYLLIHRGLMPEFADYPSKGCNAVLVGDAGESFTYAKMNTAFRLLLDGAPLFAMGNNRYFKDADGFSLDVGPFVCALEFASSAKATILGKPAPAFFRAAIRDLDCPADEVVMVGDDVEADVNGACAAGLQGILVKTGKYRAGDEQKVLGASAHVADDIVAAVAWIFENRRLKSHDH